MLGSGTSRKKVLFFSEAVTLAHMARPAVLADALAGTEFEAVLATAPRFLPLFPEMASRSVELYSMASDEFLRRLAAGRPLYDEATLERYVEDDLRVLESEQPDLVVGDFRLSLSVSARVSNVPYVALCNAYWSPYADVNYPIPEHPLVRITGLALAQRMFDLIRPVAFSIHARALNKVRTKYGLPRLGNVLQKVYTDADHLLYADIPQLVAMRPLPANHHFIGPVLWSPTQTKPDWWGQLDDSTPAIYLTLGSSGRSELLPSIVTALADLPVNLIVSTAGRAPIQSTAPNLYQSDFLPGDEATARSRIVVCNGGSLTSYQALAHGVPTVGVASNLDQHLNMQAVEQLGAGRRLRSDISSPATIKAAVSVMLDEPSYARNARSAARWIADYPSDRRFVEFLRSLV